MTGDGHVTRQWREELAWAAGFFDGEGHIRCFPQQGAYKPRRGLQISVPQIDRQVLDRLQAAVGFGRVYGPYKGPKHPDNHAPRFAYTVQSFEHVQAVVGMLWRWLSPVKQEQAWESLAMYLANPWERTKIA